MASNLLKTLQNLENSRQKCIANAKTANLDTYPNMGFPEIAGLFLNKNTTEYLGVLPEWERPTDWWDTKTILSNAEPRDGLYPAYIVLIDDYEDTTTFSNTNSKAKTAHDGILTSDGAWYTAAEFTHTWDKTKDKECSLGYKTRYFIVYVTDTKANGNDPIAPNLQLFRCLEIIWGNVNDLNITFTTDQYGNFNNGNPWLINFETLETCKATEISKGYIFTGCVNLRHAYFPTIQKITREYRQFSSCSLLTKIEFPALEITNISAGGDPFINHCHSLREVRLPKLREARNNTIPSYCYNLEKLYLPELCKCEDRVGYGCPKLKDIYIPKLITAEYVGFNCNSLESLYAPLLESAVVGNDCFSLKEVYLPSLKTLGNNSFSNTYCLSKVELPSLMEIKGSMFQFSLIEEFTFPETLITFSDTSNSFKNCINLKRLNFFEGWKFSGLNLTTCIALEKESIIDMLNKLADVTSETATYTLTLGATNLAKITAEDVAIGTNKGWTIS